MSNQLLKVSKYENMVLSHMIESLTKDMSNDGYLTLAREAYKLVSKDLYNQTHVGDMNIQVTVKG